MPKQIIRLHEKSGSDRVLRLDVPVAEPETEYEVVVETRERRPDLKVDDLGWPVGYFDSTVGSWEGDFVREPPCEFERREDY